MYAIYGNSIYLIYLYLYQAICKNLKSKRGKWGRYLRRYFYKGGGVLLWQYVTRVGGVWKWLICGNVIHGQPQIKMIPDIVSESKL